MRRNTNRKLIVDGGSRRNAYRDLLSSKRELRLFTELNMHIHTLLGAFCRCGETLRSSYFRWVWQHGRSRQGYLAHTYCAKPLLGSSGLDLRCHTEGGLARRLLLLKFSACAAIMPDDTVNAFLSGFADCWQDHHLIGNYRHWCYHSKRMWVHKNERS